MKILFKKIRTLFRLLHWQIIALKWHFIRFKPSALTNKRYSIGISTYVNRYDIFFKSLIKCFCKLFPDTEIIVAINGYYDPKIQEQYLKDIGELLKQFPNVKKIEYREGQPLSRLWNQIVINSSNEKVFIFNDDVKIGQTFRTDMEASGCLDEELILLNWSWSHFIISKKTIAEFGWFEERFPGVGNEDEDYEARMAVKNVTVSSKDIKGLKNIVFMTQDFSYGKSTETVNTKYVKGNKVFFDKKWILSDTEKEGYRFVRLLGKYAKLNEGMDTPDFYSDLKLK